jgi:hypothetical protein
MAVLNSNTAYLSIDGVNVSAYYTGEIPRDISVERVDITHGSGQAWKQSATGLYELTLGLTLVYEIDDYNTIIRPALLKLIDGTYPTVVYGPEGQVTGKPKDEFKAMTESISDAKSINKDMVVFELNLICVDTPVAYREAGGVF